VQLSRWSFSQNEGSPGNLVALEGTFVYGGKQSLKTHAGPYDGMTGSKADIGRDGFTFSAGDDFWFSGRFYIVGGTGGTSTQNVFLVDIEEAGGTSPGRRLFLTGGDAMLACDPGKFPVPATTVRQTRGKEIPIPKDSWVKIDFHIHLSADEAAGRIEVWQNDIKILDGASRTLPAATTVYNRLQVGITANGNTTFAQTVYVDDITVSKMPLR